MSTRRVLAAVIAAVIAFPVAGSCGRTVNVTDAANIPAVTFNNFDSRINGGEPIRGVDISSVISLEEAGMKFYDDNGNEADLFTKPLTELWSPAAIWALRFPPQGSPCSRRA